MDNYSLEHLNKIPRGFSNNLIWNYGHVIVTQQLLVYGLSEADTKVEDKFIEKYRKGTKPETNIDQEEYEYLKNKFIKLPNETEEDFKAGIFTNFKIYPTSYGFTLNKTKDAILFNNIHEAMHLGTMLGIRKFL